MAGNDKLDKRWDDSKQTLVDAARAAGIDPEIMVKISGFESGFDSGARPISSNPAKNKITQFDGTKAISTGYGYGQFLDGTWNAVVRQYGEKYGIEGAADMTKAQTNAPEIRDNPRLQAAMLAEFTRENIVKGAKLGGPDPEANVYAFHNLGEPDAPKFLKAMRENPNQRVDQVLSASVISGNPSLYGDGSRTLADAYKVMGQHMDRYEKYAQEARTMTGGQPTIPTPDQPNPTPDAPKPPNRPAPMADGVLERGEKGPEVKNLQEQLIKAGITSVNGKPFVADSDYGAQTEAAVREYQRTRGLKVDGEAGPQTFEALKSNKPAKAETTPEPTQGGSNWPAPGNYTINRADKPGEGHGEFGTSRGGGTRTHKGIDIEGKVGDPIESFRPGTVIAVKPNNGAAGNMVTIDHGNGLTSTYMHLNTINVKPGQEVTENTVIGTMGRTGNTPSKGDTHLHFEIRENGVAVDPMKYLKTPDQSKEPPTKPTPEPAKPTPEPTRPSAAMADGLLKEGERGPEVRQLQENLNKLGVRDAEGHPLKVDGIFGKHTEDAVERLQRQRGIAVDGVVGKDTNREITAALKEQTDKQTVGAINKPEQTPKLSDANHPDHAMYQQALTGIDKLPAGTFKSDQERQNAAAAIVHEAKVSGMTKIDQVASNNNGGLYAIQGDVNNDSHKRVFVDQQQAAAQTVERSTQLTDQLNQQKPPQAPQDEQVKEEQRRNSPVMV